MNKMLWIGVLFATAALFAGSHKKRSDSLPVKEEVMTLSEFAGALVNGRSKSELRNVVLQCPAGTLLPLKLAAKGELFTFEPSDASFLSLKLQRPCFLKLVDKKHLLFSEDGQSWKPFSDCFTGVAGASLGLHENYYPFANLEVELKATP